MSGYSKDEIIGKNANILRHPDMSQNFYKNLWKELRAKKIWQGEVKNIDKLLNFREQEEAMKKEYLKTHPSLQKLKLKNSENKQ